MSKLGEIYMPKLGEMFQTMLLAKSKTIHMKKRKNEKNVTARKSFNELIWTIFIPYSTGH